jgi:hypothetical protein
MSNVEGSVHHINHIISVPLNLSKYVNLTDPAIKRKYKELKKRIRDIEDVGKIEPSCCY